MLKRTGYGGICVACLVLILSACRSEKGAADVHEIHAGDALTSFSQEITSSIHEFDLKVSETYILDITVKNTGTQPWFGGSVPAPGNGVPVNVGYRWIDADGTDAGIEGNRAVLNNVIQPGASEQLKLQVVAPPNPGSYTLWVSMVQEHVAWFFTKGAKPLTVKVTVA